MKAIQRLEEVSSSVIRDGKISQVSQFRRKIDVRLPSLLDTTLPVFRQTSHPPQTCDTPCIVSEPNVHLLSNHAFPSECFPRARTTSKT